MGGEWPWISTGRRNKERRRPEGVCAYTYVRKSKAVTAAQGGDWGVKIGWGIWKDYSPSSVSSFFGSFSFLEG